MPAPGGSGYNRRMTLSTPAIHLTDATVRFGRQSLFENLSLTLTGGSLTALLGSSGIGKSTLLRLIAGLPAPAPTPGEKISWRQSGAPSMDSVALMDQRDLLLPWATVLQNTVIGDTLRRQTPDIHRAESLLSDVGLSDSLHKRPKTLSGGMRQRTALARTLYENRPVVLMDEPFARLDAITRQRLQTLACTLLHEKTVLLVTHDPLEALRMADDILVLSGSPPALSRPCRPDTPPPRSLDDSIRKADYARIMEVIAS